MNYISTDAEFLYFFKGNQNMLRYTVVYCGVKPPLQSLSNIY